MRSLANPETDGSYTVTVRNYRGYTFSPWEDGSTDSTWTVAAGRDAITTFFELR